MFTVSSGDDMLFASPAYLNQSAGTSNTGVDGDVPALEINRAALNASRRRVNDNQQRPGLELEAYTAFLERYRIDGELLLSSMQYMCLGAVEMLARMHNRVMHSLNGNRPSKISKPGAGANRRHRNRQNQKARSSASASASDRESVGSDVESSVVCNKESTTDIVPDRPRFNWVPSCDDLGEPHRFGGSLYCTKCGHYEGCGTRDGASAVDFGEFIFERSERSAECRITARGGTRTESPVRSGQATGYLNGNVAGALLQQHSQLPKRSWKSAALEGVSKLSALAKKRAAKLRFKKRKEEGVDAPKYSAECAARGIDVRRQRAKKVRYPIGQAPPELAANTYGGIIAMFDDGSESFCRPPAPPKPKPPPDFTERRSWLAPLYKHLGYEYDAFSFGELGVELRGIHLGKDGGIESVAENENLSEADLRKRINHDLYVYLYAKKLPRSQYSKNGKFDVELLKVHMHKLTDQFYAKHYPTGVPKELRTLECVERDAYTQGYAVSETSKDFLLSEQTTTKPKETGFLRAWRNHKRLIAAGVILGCVTLAAKRPSAAMVGRYSLLLTGSALALTLGKSMSNALPAAFSGFLNRPSSAVQGLIC